MKLAPTYLHELKSKALHHQLTLIEIVAAFIIILAISTFCLYVFVPDAFK